MPNIEVHGNPSNILKQRVEIADLFVDAKYLNDIVITVVVDKVYDIHGKLRPFLRVIFAKDDPAEVGGVRVYDDCLKRLAELNMDIEVVIIHKFIPKKE